ncbi:ranBP-type and C3HC4-type zinc finger-containing protein 1 isoform X2 [Strongylocentrotus purpuratus]|uniref:RanBP-type and C3HC4-type zinc finger-containing protein 1 n=1 Tax=Strongylocentrotus purpuratus TaxID=7668 RepID=A0A7M7NTS5_STRPU|nr:ranBP-type and C3HC4-type zinc finger-containing protein 1 isoform X2 [Strongylocentrotus purpuratus]
MHSSLSRGHTSGITVVLSGRGFLSSYPETRRRDPNGSPPAKNGYDGGLLNAPVKLQLVNHKHGGYSIRVVHNDDRPRSQPIISENLDDISVLNHTAQEFEFLLNRDGSRHLMLFSSLDEGQQFQLIFGAVNVQGRIGMTSKRGVAPMAARFPGQQGSNDVGGGGGGATIKKKGSKTENDRVPMSTPMGNGGDDIDVQTMVELLKSSIQAGDVKNAEIWAGNLANHQPKLSILVETAGTTVSSSSEISIHVQVEDKDSSKLKLRMSVPSNITIAGLKKMTCLTYALPTPVQNWLIGGRIAKDTETLATNGISSSGATLYLYLTSALKVNTTKHALEIEKHAISEERKHPRHTSRPELNRTKEPQTLQRTSNNFTEGRGTLRTSHSRVTSPPLHEPDSIQRLAPSTSSSSDRWSSGPRSPQVERVPEVKKKPTAMEVGWVCTACTLVNPPLIPGCQACTTARPEAYSVPTEGSYSIDPSERAFQKESEEKEQAFLEERELVIQNYQDLLRIDDQDLVLNREPFDCPVCLVDYESGEGVVLRECLHIFCRECVSQHVMQSTDALVKCPGMENGVPCTQHVLEREIKTLLSEENFQKYLERGLRRAESSAANSFHCKTTDCRGFCFYEDNNNFFNCPLCKRLNCLTCKAIHEGIDCKQYQEDLKTRAQNDVSARQTQETLEELVRSGEAMKCPNCSIIVQKKGGCDWIKCSVCQMEICWVTKQARWGKGGTGDITGGCRCRVNGQPCHPNCHNCH